MNFGTLHKHVFFSYKITHLSLLLLCDEILQVSVFYCQSRSLNVQLKRFFMEITVSK